MKLIPCPTCKREALGPPSPKMPEGEPVAFGRFTGGESPIMVKCFRCGGSFRLGALDFNALPEAEPDRLRAIGLTGLE